MALQVFEDKVISDWTWEEAQTVAVMKVILWQSPVLIPWLSEKE
jgi:hypothetical protein